MTDPHTQLLERSLERARQGKIAGVAIIEVVALENSDWATSVYFQGPLLCLLAGASQLTHGINAGLRENSPIQKVSS